MNKDPDLNISNEAVDSAFSELEEFNSYYDNVSVIFRVISFVMFAVLLVFTVSSAFVSADEFSYKNLEFIMRNFALTLEENKDSARQPIRFNPDSVNQFDLFGEGLAICGSNSLSIFSATGRQTCSESFSYRVPVMRSSDKFVLVYDEGTGNYSIYNSFSRVHSCSSVKPIKDAVLSNSGYYALITSSDLYNSTVEIYDPNYSLISRYNKNGYVSCVDVAEGKASVITCDAANDSAKFSIEILISDINDPGSAVTAKFDAGYPLGCKVVKDGVFVVCTDSLYFFDSDCKLVADYDYEGASISDFVFGSDSVCLLFKSHGFKISYDLLCFDSSVSVVYRTNISETVFDIDICDGVSFVLTENSVLRFTADSEDSVDIGQASFGCSVNAYDVNSIYYCSDSFATVLKFSSD